MKTYTYLITPTNEGQPLGYTETFKVMAGNKAEAQVRANIRENQITAGLMVLLPNGSWNCEVEAV